MTCFSQRSSEPVCRQARRGRPPSAWPSSWPARGWGSCPALPAGSTARRTKGASVAAGTRWPCWEAGSTVSALPCSQGTARGLLEAGGTILSEYPPGTLPLKHHFPARNRIISGLARAVVVVQAPERSGALITAEYALEQGRDLFVHADGIIGTTGAGSRALADAGAPVIRGAGALLADWGRAMQHTGAPARQARGECAARARRRKAATPSGRRSRGDCVRKSKARAPCRAARHTGEDDGEEAQERPAHRRVAREGQDDREVPRQGIHGGGLDGSPHRPAQVAPGHRRRGQLRARVHHRAGQGEDPQGPEAEGEEGRRGPARLG